MDNQHTESMTREDQPATLSQTGALLLFVAACGAVAMLLADLQTPSVISVFRAISRLVS